MTDTEPVIEVALDSGYEGPEASVGWAKEPSDVPTNNSSIGGQINPAHPTTTAAGKCGRYTMNSSSTHDCRGHEPCLL